MSIFDNNCEKIIVRCKSGIFRPMSDSEFEAFAKTVNESGGLSYWSDCIHSGESSVAETLVKLEKLAKDSNAMKLAARKTRRDYSRRHVVKKLIGRKSHINKVRMAILNLQKDKHDSSAIVKACHAKGNSCVIHDANRLIESYGMIHWIKSRQIEFKRKKEIAARKRENIAKNPIAGFCKKDKPSLNEMPNGRVFIGDSARVRNNAKEIVKAHKESHERAMLRLGKSPSANYLITKDGPEFCKEHKSRVENQNLPMISNGKRITAKPCKRFQKTQ